MIYEDLRSIHEDTERLEQAIADRILDEPKSSRLRLIRDHEIANFLSRIATQSARAQQIYTTSREDLTAEEQLVGSGDPFDELQKRLASIKDFHKRYPGGPVDNLERAYKRRPDEPKAFAGDVDGMFTGEEAFGRYFDLTMLHEEYLNLPGVKGARKLTYLQYLDVFDVFTPPECPINRDEKMTDEFFTYVGSLAQYLESFVRRVRPLEDLDKLFETFDRDFEQAWAENSIPGWEEIKAAQSGSATEGTGEGVWCADCAKEFKNENVYKAHLTGKKHIKAAEARKAQQDGGDVEMSGIATSAERVKEKVIAEREHRIRRLAASMSSEREDTRVNVERKAGMTDRERQQELAALYAEDEVPNGRAGGPANGSGDGDEEDDDDDDDDERVYNPLKLPLAWDGKPIPFWLYKLHGLGVEFPCEICGNYVYMGRRAFEKHFAEARHIYGLKCLGITNTSLFREITRIEEAERLWDKMQRDKAQTSQRGDAVEEMEDSEGNVMPKKVYEDLLKQGLL